MGARLLSCLFELGRRNHMALTLYQPLRKPRGWIGVPCLEGVWHLIETHVKEAHVKELDRERE